MKRDDRSTLTIAELRPRQLTTIRRKLKHTRLGHGAYCPILSPYGEYRSADMALFCLIRG